MSLKIRIPKSVFKELECTARRARYTSYATPIGAESTIMKLITGFGTVELLSTPDEEFTEERSEVVTKFKDITI
jgi:hypothetical protein